MTTWRVTITITDRAADARLRRSLERSRRQRPNQVKHGRHAKCAR